MLRFYKIWLILLGVSLIFLDKYTFISSVRDNITMFVENKVSLTKYRIKSYPSLLVLNIDQQHSLAKQNVELKKQVEQYSLKLQQIENNSQDLKNIHEIQSASSLQDNYHQIVAKSILDINYFVNNKLLVEFDKNQTVKIGDAVVNKDGVIGQVLSVNANNAQVSLVTNPNVKMYLQSAKNKSKMLAQGAGNNTVVVKYIDKNDDVQVGDILETTGLDDTYPGNIPVVKVQKVFTENSGFNSAICVPVVDFSQLQYVLVLENANK